MTTIEHLLSSTVTFCIHTWIFLDDILDLFQDHLITFLLRIVAIPLEPVIETALADINQIRCGPNPDPVRVSPVIPDNFVSLLYRDFLFTSPALSFIMSKVFLRTFSRHRVCLPFSPVRLFWPGPCMDVQDRRMLSQDCKYIPFSTLLRAFDAIRSLSLPPEQWEYPLRPVTGSQVLVRGSEKFSALSCCTSIIIISYQVSAPGGAVHYQVL